MLVIHVQVMSHVKSQEPCPTLCNLLDYRPPGSSDGIFQAILEWVPELGRSLGGGHSNPLQYSCWENSMDRGAWRATVPGVTRSRTRLSNFHSHWIQPAGQPREPTFPEDLWVAGHGKGLWAKVSAFLTKSNKLSTD